MSPVIQAKLEDLCRTLLSLPEVESHRLQVDQFLINEEARSQYVQVSEAGEHLHHKQSQGVALADAEVAAFEAQRTALINNPVARGFLDAQEALQDLQQSIQKYVSKSLELGRLPEESELDCGGCGNGCGCHH
jgi:cell fate (sporulation/competence/biofilm development) regulator YlbF (YheA/YmcA/DUF963 family)